MHLFKQHLPSLFRRPTQFFADLPENEDTQSLNRDLNKLVQSVRKSSERKLLLAEAQSFATLFARYTAGKQSLKWDQVSLPTAGQIIAYDRLPDKGTAGLPKLAVLKVNGGLGTTMGLNGAKSALEVQNDLTFLDLVVKQIEHLNTLERVDVPLLLMTSFNTEDDTQRIVKKYANRAVKITTFNQSRYPRVLEESMTLLAKKAHDSKSAWYPPGHGDLYNALDRSGVLDRLLSAGKEYLFVSNSDNLGAVVDKRIFQYMIETESEFIMEVTSKTRIDMKGGTLINYNGTLQLLEMTQIPTQFMDEFHSGQKFKVFNTNNLWINLKALKRVLEKNNLPLDVISKSKKLEDGRTVLHLETAAGSAIKHFQNAHGVHVPRSRFLPVKNCSDLLLVKSDLYVIENGRLTINEDRMFGTTPVIKLGEHFRKIHQFQKRFKQIPHIIDLDHLTVAGDVHFGRNVTLRGTVIIAATEGQRIDIPDGCVLENRLVSGNLNMIEL